jgi:hypothetical protein
MILYGVGVEYRFPIESGEENRARDSDKLAQCLARRERDAVAMLVTQALIRGPLRELFDRLCNDVGIIV